MATMETATNSITTSRHSKVSKLFFDLPPEIRNKIYYYLFRGIVVPITVKISQRPDLIKPGRQRDQAMGLNMLLASKSCLSEAKPVLFAEAMFDIDYNIDRSEWPGKWRRRSERILRISPGCCLMGFSSNDLSQVRRIRHSTGSPCSRCTLCTQPFSKVSQLSSVEIIMEEIRYPNLHSSTIALVEHDDKYLIPLFKNRFGNADGCLHKTMFQYMRQRATRGQAAELVLKLPLYLMDGLMVMTIKAYLKSR